MIVITSVAASYAVRAEPRAERAASKTAEPAAPTEKPDAELQAIEQELKALKGKLVAHKAKLAEIKTGTAKAPAVEPGSAQISVIHCNEMKGRYLPTQYTYTLDGVELFAHGEEGGLLTKSDLKVFSGKITPGGHTLVVHAEYRGNGKGMYSYMKDVRASANVTHLFHAADDKPLQLKVVSSERGASAVPEKRILIEVQESSWRVLAPSGDE